MGISNKAVSRLSLYRSALARFKTYGAVKIYSCDLAKALGLTAAQVRKDFSLFGFAGKKKVGYDIAGLIKNIDDLLQKDRTNTAVLCGTGMSSSSLFINQLLAAQGISIVAAFDNQPLVVNCDTITTVPLLPLESLVSFVTDNRIRFGIIATDGKTTQRMLDLLVLAGVQGVLNLTGIDIKAPKQCRVITVSVVREFEKLAYYLAAPAEKGAR